MRTALLALALTAAAATVALATDTDGRTTLDQRVTGTGPSSGFRRLGLAPGEAYVTREERVGTAQAGRERRRRSLIYLGHLSDFQLADEESPARVEFVDPAPDSLGLTAAWRPWEALMPYVVDAGIRQVNRLARASTVKQGNGRRARMALALTTGDSADNQQRNETAWTVRLLEGGTIDPNSGDGDPSHYDAGCRLAATLGQLDPSEAARYTGVQDFDDYLEGPTPFFYDPDDPRGRFAGWPRHPGLMDRAQQAFGTPGLSVPSYVVFGNHDGLAQGNQAANASFEAVATGCVKPMAPVLDVLNLQGALAQLNPQNLQGMLASQPGKVALVPPDERRQYVSKAQYKALHRTGAQPDAHGFGYVDPGELAASRGAAGYYSFSPIPGIRLIGLDTVAESGVAALSDDGNVDDPQFRWLERELRRATDRDELVLVYSHHAIASLVTDLPDEIAPPCTAQTARGHDVNPGCDVDPRSSAPIHLGDDLVALLHRYPHVVGWIAGHSHRNVVEPYAARGGGGFWSVRSAAEADWPQQARLLDVMDNGDGTLSLFGTVIDHVGASVAPAAGSPAAGMTGDALASLARTFSYNDPQEGGNPALGAVHGEGTPKDRNVELLVRDPRRDPLRYAPAGAGRCARAAGRLAGTSLGRARLGRTRARIRRSFPRRSLSRPRKHIDRFCLVGGKSIRVGYPSSRLRARMGARDRRRTRGRAILLLSSRRRYAVKGVRAGDPTRALRRRIHALRRVRTGKDSWYLARGRRARLVFRVRGRRVLEVGIADRRLTSGARRARLFLRSFSG